MSSNITLHTSLKEKGLAQLTDCTSSSPVRFHLQNLQKLTSCVISIIRNFLARFVQKMFMTKIKPFRVTSVNLYIKC